MRNLLIILGITGLAAFVPAAADDGNPLDYQFEFSFERSALDGLSLGDDLTEDRLIEEDYEFEFVLEYGLNADLYLFFTGSFINETEAIETIDKEEKENGFERKEIGIGYFFGDEIASELKVGRREFASVSEWWLWWDEELDAISIDSNYGDFELLLGFAEEQARDKTDADFIDPELDGVKRVIFSLDWEFSPSQSLILYYLDQEDNSDSFYSNSGSFEDCNDGPPPSACVSEDFDKIDEEDADLTWTGISYLGEFDNETVGEIEIELHYARVSGDEVVYEFDDPDPVTDLSEVTSRQENSVSGSARSILLNWTPPVLDDWTLIVGKASASGDSNPDNMRDKSFRQTGLQGDSESFGELYQPELSNLEVDLIGVSWEVQDGVNIALLRFDYEQDELADEMRDVSIELDLTGSSRDLGQEIDLVVTIDAGEGVEIILTAAEFDPGDAYGANRDETSNFINFELTYEF